MQHNHPSQLQPQHHHHQQQNLYFPSSPGSVHSHNSQGAIDCTTKLTNVANNRSNGGGCGGNGNGEQHRSSSTRDSSVGSGSHHHSTETGLYHHHHHQNRQPDKTAELSFIVSPSPNSRRRTRNFALALNLVKGFWRNRFPLSLPILITVTGTPLLSIPLPLIACYLSYTSINYIIPTVCVYLPVLNSLLSPPSHTYSLSLSLSPHSPPSFVRYSQCKQPWQETIHISLQQYRRK